MGAEHLCTEDPRPSGKLHDRVQLAQKLKGLIVNDQHRLRALYRGAMTVTPKFRLTQSFNSDPDSVRFFPPLTPDFRDKCILLRVISRPLPMPTFTPDERRAFREKISEQLPAYLHYLLYEFKLPEALKNERFGVREFADPEIRSMLSDDSPAAEFLEILDETELTVDKAGSASVRGTIFQGECGYTVEEAVEKYRFTQPSAAPVRRVIEYARAAGLRVWIGKFAQLQEAMEHATSSRQKVAAKLIHHNSVPRMLGRLSQDQPDRVALHRTEGERLWVISAPRVETDAAAEVAAF
jgi:hypothetical protein